MDEMREHLAVECRRLREDAGISRTEVAAKIKRGEQSVARFERGLGEWNPQTGAMVAAYAELAGMPAPELWMLAILAWAEAAGPESLARTMIRAAQARAESGPRSQDASA